MFKDFAVPLQARVLAVPVASGLIVGEGVWALPQVLATLYTKPILSCTAYQPGCLWVP